MLKLVSALALGLFAAPSAVEAQPAGKVTRVVGYLTQGSAEDARSGLDAFRTALRELGYVEGETIVIEPRYVIRLVPVHRANWKPSELQREHWA